MYICRVNICTTIAVNHMHALGCVQAEEVVELYSAGVKGRANLKDYYHIHKAMMMVRILMANC